MPADVRALLRLELPLTAEIGRRPIRMDEALRLRPGSILDLGKPADDPLEIRVNNRPIGVGRAVKVGESLGIRVVRVGDVRERIDALGAAPETGDGPGT